MTRADSVHSPRGECSLADLSDDALVTRVAMLVQTERRATTEVIVALAEFDRRKLYLGQGCSSLFTYCTQVLHLSEHAAFNRIEAARAASRFPALLTALEQGFVNLATVRVLAPILTPDNQLRLLDAARFKSKRDVEHLVASERPQPDVRDSIRSAPTARLASANPPEVPAPGVSGQPIVKTPATTLATQQPPAVSTPIAPERFKFQFTASRAFENKFRRAQTLLRHSLPHGEMDLILERGLDLLIPTLEKTKFGATDRPRSTSDTVRDSRHIPAAVKREVWKRDSGRCAFVGTLGRCTEEAFLEFHHVIPFAEGGAATTTNIELRCRAHNAYEAQQHFGLLPPCDH